MLGGAWLLSSLGTACSTGRGTHPCPPRRATLSTHTYTSAPASPQTTTSRCWRPSGRRASRTSASAAASTFPRPRWEGRPRSPGSQLALSGLHSSAPACHRALLPWAAAARRVLFGSLPCAPPAGHPLVLLPQRHLPGANLVRPAVHLLLSAHPGLPQLSCSNRCELPCALRPACSWADECKEWAQILALPLPKNRWGPCLAVTWGVVPYRFVPQAP